MCLLEIIKHMNVTWVLAIEKQQYSEIVHIA